MNKTADSKWNKQKEKHFQNKIKSCQPRRFQNSKEHVKYQFGKLPEIIKKLPEKMISSQLDIKLWIVYGGKLDPVEKKTRAKKL